MHLQIAMKTSTFASRSEHEAHMAWCNVVSCQGLQLLKPVPYHIPVPWHLWEERAQWRLRTKQQQDLAALQEAEHHQSMRNMAAGMREIHWDICTSGASVDAGLHKVTQQAEFSGCQFPPADTESSRGSEAETVEVSKVTVSLPLSLSTSHETHWEKHKHTHTSTHTYIHAYRRTYTYVHGCKHAPHTGCTSTHNGMHTYTRVIQENQDSPTVCCNAHLSINQHTTIVSLSHFYKGQQTILNSKTPYNNLVMCNRHSIHTYIRAYIFTMLTWTTEALELEGSTTSTQLVTWPKSPLTSFIRRSTRPWQFCKTHSS